MGSLQGQLTWFDREGKALGAFGDSGAYRTLALSLDGKRVAFERSDPKNPSVHNIWLYDFARGAATRLTFDSAWDSNPVWSPDGDHIVFGSDRDGEFNLYRRNASLSGEDELLFKSPEPVLPSSWSPDGRVLLYYNPRNPSQLSLLPLGGSEADRKPVLIESSEFNQIGGSFSPDGRWIAYLSDESGRNEIYVRSFDISFATEKSASKESSVTGKWMVSKDGATGFPLWRRDGRELFYLSVDGSAMAVDVNTGEFQSGIPKALFKVPTGVLFWDVSSDGKRFLMTVPSAAIVQPPFTVVLNWPSLLRK